MIKILTHCNYFGENVFYVCFECEVLVGYS